MEQTERFEEKITENLKQEIIARMEHLFKGGSDIQKLRSEIHRQLGWIILVSGRWQEEGEEVSAEKIIGNFNIKGREAKTVWEPIRYQASEVIAKVMNENPLVPGKLEEAKAPDTTAWLNKNNVEKLTGRLGRDFDAFIRDKDGMACLRLWADKFKKEQAEEKSAGISFRDVYDFMMEKIFGKEKKESAGEKVSKEAAVALCRFLLKKRYRREEDEVDFSNPLWQEKLVQWAGVEKLWFFTHKNKLKKYTNGKITLYQCLQPYLDNMDKVNSQEYFRKAFVVFCREYLGFDYNAVFTKIRRAESRRLRKEQDAKKRQERLRYIPEEVLLDEKTLKEAIKQAFGLQNHNFRTASNVLFSTPLDKIVSKSIVIRGRRIRFEALLKARKNERHYTFGKVWRHILIDTCGFKDVPRIKWGPHYHRRTDLQRKAFMLAFGFDDKTDFADPKIRQILENPPPGIFFKELDVDPDLDKITLAHFCKALNSGGSRSANIFYYKFRRGSADISRGAYESLVVSVTGLRISAKIKASQAE